MTWAHSALASGQASVHTFLLTVFLAFCFLGVQGLEYYLLPFTVSDSIFGRVFYLSTGFHGLHVVVGALLLSWRVLRLVL